MLVPATAEDLRVGSKIILDNQESPVSKKKEICKCIYIYLLLSSLYVLMHFNAKGSGCPISRR